MQLVETNSQIMLHKLYFHIFSFRKKPRGVQTGIQDIPFKHKREKSQAIESDWTLALVMKRLWNFFLSPKRVGNWLDTASSTYCSWFCFKQNFWTRQFPEVPSNLSYEMILWFYIWWNEFVSLKKSKYLIPTHTSFFQPNDFSFLLFYWICCIGWLSHSEKNGQNQ